MNAHEENKQSLICPDIKECETQPVQPEEKLETPNLATSASSRVLDVTHHYSSKDDMLYG